MMQIMSNHAKKSTVGRPAKPVEEQVRPLSMRLAPELHARILRLRKRRPWGVVMREFANAVEGGDPDAPHIDR